MKLQTLLSIVVVLTLAIYIFIPTESRVSRRALLNMSRTALKIAAGELHNKGTHYRSAPLMRALGRPHTL